MLPVPIHTVQTDNGSEFEAVFDRYCLDEKIKHLWTEANLGEEIFPTGRMCLAV